MRITHMKIELGDCDLEFFLDMFDKFSWVVWWKSSGEGSRDSYEKGDDADFNTALSAGMAALQERHDRVGVNPNPRHYRCPKCHILREQAASDGQHVDGARNPCDGLLRVTP